MISCIARQKLGKVLARLFLATTMLFGGPSAFGQNRTVLQSEDFQSVLVTSLYCTAFGAATGAALLPFVAGSPTDNLRFVSGGASIGFLLGSAIGFYNVSQAQQVSSYVPTEDEPERSGRESRYGFEYDPGLHELPRGSLVVGVGSRVGIDFPLPNLGKRSFMLSLLDLRF